jgi:hypothetical protein
VEINLVEGLPTGGCAFDPCVADGSCAVATNNMCGGGCGGTNGVRRCGAASSSTVGWGGEPDRAIDGNTDGNWGGGSCTHTDTNPAWWQVDLGQTSTINRVGVFHRTNCCQDRLASANIIVSDTSDFTTGTNCGALTDYSQQPETTNCDAISGQFVTVSLTGGSSGGVVVTICETEVWGYFASGLGGGGASGPAASTNGCKGDIHGMWWMCTDVEMTGTGDQGDTFVITGTPGGLAENTYTIFGDADDAMSIPAAYQEAAPFGANTGGVNAAFVAVSASAAFDSWLSVGITDGDAAGRLGSVGIDWSAWTADAGVDVDNGAVFWMVPTDGPAGASVLAPITVPSGAEWTVLMNAQGKAPAPTGRRALALAGLARTTRPVA